MDTATYWPRVFWRAFIDTCKFFGGWRILLPPIFFMVGAFIHLYRAGEDSVLEELDVTVSFGIGAFLAIFAALFTINFIFTPPRFESEAATSADDREQRLNIKIDDLDKRIFDREKRQRLVDELWQLRSNGIKLRNKQFEDKAKFERSNWLDCFKTWRNDTLLKANEISPNLKQWLDRLDRTVPNPPELSFFSVEHERLSRIASTMLDRMQRYLEGELDLERRL